MVSGLSLGVLGLCLSRDLSERSKLDDCVNVLIAFHNSVSASRLSASDGTSEVSMFEAGGRCLARGPFHNQRNANTEITPWTCFQDERLAPVLIRYSFSSPILALVRASLRLCDLEGNRINQMQTLIEDTIGLTERPSRLVGGSQEGNPLNTFEVLLRNGLLVENAFAETLNAHNVIMQLFLSEPGPIQEATSSTVVSTLHVRTNIHFCNAMIQWMLPRGDIDSNRLLFPGLRKSVAMSRMKSMIAS